MPSWTYVIYPKTDFATLDFTNDVETNSTLNPIYITVQDDDANFQQMGGDTGALQTITASSDPSLVGQTIFSEVYGSMDTLFDDSSGSDLTINEISIGGSTNWVLANLDGVNTTLSPSTTYSETSIRSDTFWAHSGMLACFTAGTQIQTPDRVVQIERLRAGDAVWTADHGETPIAWIGRRRIDASMLRADRSLRPIHIAQGAMGGGLPQRDLRVSPQHRMLVRSRIAHDLFGADEALIPATKLVGLPGITKDNSRRPVTYVHILCRRHEIIFAEHCPSETLFLGPRVLDAAASKTSQGFAHLPLDQFSRRPARPLVQGKCAARFTDAHRAQGCAPLDLDCAPVEADHLPGLPHGRALPPPDLLQSARPSCHRPSDLLFYPSPGHDLGQIG